MFLGKCRRLLRTGFKLLKKRGDRLLPRERELFEKDLRALDDALVNKQYKTAKEIAPRIKTFTKTHFPKTFFDQLKEIAGALVFAIVVAFLIRQFWFELYEVPTGSMRPTVEELDRMVVSKTPFGINIPFTNKQLFFTNDLINRTGIIVFTVAGMDVPDSDMLYFYLFPGKKRFIKRAMGKPGDTLYFYGGKIYGLDEKGEVITDLDNEYIENLEHVPYISMEGKMDVGKRVAPNVYDSVTLKQMNKPVGRMQLTRTGKIDGTFYNGHAWVPDRPEALKAPRDEPKSYSDLWGIGNYAMARLLTEKQTKDFYGTLPEGEAALYLELHHTPSLTSPKPQMRYDEQGRIHPMITPYTALIPLTQSHLDTLMKSLFTARFHVKDGHAYRYHEGRGRPQRPEYDPLFKNVPNGLYEFYYGQGYKIHFGGIRTKLDTNNPLYETTPENVQKLFNMGIGFNRVFSPMDAYQPYLPQRFAYYNNGDLYVMGAPLLKSTDPTLIRFIQSETEKQEKSSRESPYIAFIDPGAPTPEKIANFGLTIPENGVLALGDNYAMSADSRDFGFVPTHNLRGAPSFTFWPPGDRLGPLPQPSYPWLTITNVIIWGLVVLIIIVIYLWNKKRNSTSLFD